MKIETEENEVFKKTSNNRFRKTKKFSTINNNSSQTHSVGKYPNYQTKTKSYQKTTMNEEMMNLSAAFTELKKRNVSFLA